MTDTKDIVNAIKQRKKEFIAKFGITHGANAEDTMYFNHICIVLDHAQVLMSHTLEQLIERDQDVEEEIKDTKREHKWKEL